MKPSHSQKPYRVLFVCLGNICRSPLAEGILQYWVDQKGLSDQFHVDSCGTAAYHVGELADPRSRAVAIRHGFTLTHRARAFHEDDFKRFDWIIVMDQSNRANVLKKTLHSADLKKVFMMSAFDQDGRFPAEVPDPYTEADEAFETVFEQLQFCILKMLTHIVNAAINNSHESGNH